MGRTQVILCIALIAAPFFLEGNGITNILSINQVKLMMIKLNTSIFVSTVKCSEDEERLVRDLFRGYNKLIRPVQNMTQKVDVRFGLAFVQLINVVSTNRIAHTSFLSLNY